MEFPICENSFWFQPNGWRLSGLADIRYLVTILTGILYSRFGVRAQSLGQSLPSRSKTARLCSMSSFGCEARVSCSRVLGGFLFCKNKSSNNTLLFP
jgi:hypothetical protein